LGDNLILHLRKSDGPKAARHSSSNLFKALAEYCCPPFLETQQVWPPEAAPVTHIKDYQPQGTDFRVEYLYSGVHSSLAFSVPSSPFAHSQTIDIFNPTFTPIIATVFGICSSKLFYWLSPICSRLDTPLNKHPYLPILNCILALATSAHARCVSGFRTWYPTPRLDSEHNSCHSQGDIGAPNPC
jgi:hypothetical protein